VPIHRDSTGLRLNFNQSQGVRRQVEVHPSFMQSHLLRLRKRGFPIQLLHLERRRIERAPHRRIALQDISVPFIHALNLYLCVWRNMRKFKVDALLRSVLVWIHQVPCGN